jgi:hypothetical protein
MKAEYKMELIKARHHGVECFRVLGYRNGELAFDRRALSEAGARTLYLQWLNKEPTK